MGIPSFYLCCNLLMPLLLLLLLWLEEHLLKRETAVSRAG